ncbi:MAG: TonB-dependent receptor [Alcaligenaceae bacterium]|nr:TonB-dependent receptor [Alcaligenaceae bacterium]
MTFSNPGLSFKAKHLTLLLGAALGTTLAGTAAAQQSVQQLDSVVVTASGFEQDIKQAPASISVITGKQLEEKSYTDLAGALRDVEGIDVRGATGKTGNLNVSIRGMPSEYTLVLIDGRRQNAAGDVTPNGFGATSTGFIPPMSAIERIEVIRGPMSTLYGADAMGGVINIITKKVANEWNGSVTLSTQLEQNNDAADTHQANFYLSGPIVEDTLGVQIRGSVLRRGDSKLEFDDGNTVSTRGPSPVNARNYTMGAKFTLTPNKDHDIWLDLDRSRQSFNNDNCQLGNLDGTAGTRGANTCQPHPTEPGIAHGYEDKLRFNRDQVAIGHTSRLSFGTVESSLMRNKTETLGRTIPKEAFLPAEQINNPRIGAARTLETTNTVFDTKLIAPIGDNHLLTIGGQYWRASMTDGLISDKYKQDTWALFAEDEWMLRDDLALTLGARYDHHDAFGSQISPRGYLVYNPTDNWTFKGGVSRGYKTPSLERLHSGVNGISSQGENVNVGNPDLQPEVSTSTELGAHYDSLQGWTVGLTGFHNRIRDKMSQVSCGADSSSPTWIASCDAALPYIIAGLAKTDPVNVNPRYYRNLDKATTQGLEFTSSIAFNDAWSLRLNYTYTDSEVKANGKNIGELSDTPEHMANATLRWDANDRFSFWLQGEYRGKSRRFDGKYENYTTADKETYDALGDLKAYTVFNLGGQYRVSKDVTLNGTIYNLFDKDFLECKNYTNSSGTVVCGSPYIQSGSSTKGTLPYAGRAFWVSANIAF